MESFLNKEYDMDSIFEILELMKKNIIENNQDTLDNLKEKLAEIEKQRIQVVKGNQDIIKKIINDYNNMKI